MNHRAWIGSWRRCAVGVALLAGVQAPGSASATHASYPGEMIVYDWNRPVGKVERGFPRDFPPRENGNWTSPVNYAQGTYYLRVQIRDQPVAQKMRLQFCVWQDGTRPMREMCSPLADVRGAPGTVVTWSVPVVETKLSRKKAIVWTKPRRTNGVAIKDERGYPISDYGNPSWNWFGENPNAWYPLDMRFTVVVVAKGHSFGGWSRYIHSDSLQAEAATLYRAVVATDHTGYTGTGFVDYRNNTTGGYVEWTTTATAARTASLGLRYANGTGSERPVDVIVNGVTVQPRLMFPPTGSWDEWRVLSVTAPLRAGSNTVRARAVTSSGGPNLDRLEIGPAP